MNYQLKIKLYNILYILNKRLCILNIYPEWVELRAWCLLGRYSLSWATPPVHFLLVIFEKSSHFMPGLWSCLCFVEQLGMTDTCHITQPLLVMGSCKLFLVQADLELISASWVTRITDLSCNVWLKYSYI
jgi:hypothetical protein